MKEKHINNILNFLSRDTLMIKASEVQTYNICITFLHSLKDGETGKKAKKALEEITNGQER